KKNNSNCSLILISLKCGTSVKNYLSNSLIPACILSCNKNKALYRFLIDFKKFVKLLSLSIFLFNFFPPHTAGGLRQSCCLRHAERKTHILQFDILRICIKYSIILYF
ncbi:hypothetical protein E6A52_09505, partial [Brachyspira hampsonii]|nr:hypothetical protein [Brachyspira hampsonii]